MIIGTVQPNRVARYVIPRGGLPADHDRPCVAPPDGWRYPYGPSACQESAGALQRWTEREGVRFDRRAGTEPLRWLLRGTPDALIRANGWDGVDPINRARRSWADHVTTWRLGSGRALIVCQPYELTGTHLAELAELEARYPTIQVAVRRRPSWYLHGTYLVEIARRDLYPLA